MSDKEPQPSNQQLSCYKVFSIFCCPPCPRQMSEKLIFMPPSPPCYSLELVEKGDHNCIFTLSPDSDTSGFKNILQQQSRLVKTSRGNDIAVLFVRCTRQKEFTILYSHGNSVDLGRVHKLCVQFSRVFDCDVVTYDYSGYGRSSGHPSEKNLYADIKAAWDYVLAFHEHDPKKIILYGHSLGTAPTIDLASKVQCAGVVLQSSFMSSVRVVCSGRNLLKCMDRYKK